ncbi:hypothetical protein QAD02_001427 [Eretmocerus hayati]|uniref:Uncharacterized protein n=1 Tax=Eretmocerus hayati TaxID=131215 RepID=A0ACC2NGY6_9HYME|nr:hypothetical protein QAD02_001427 [Eretmocerus hayati]
MKKKLTRERVSNSDEDRLRFIVLSVLEEVLSDRKKGDDSDDDDDNTLICNTNVSVFNGKDRETNESDESVEKSEESTKKNTTLLDILRVPATMGMNAAATTLLLKMIERTVPWSKTLWSVSDIVKNFRTSVFEYVPNLSGSLPLANVTLSDMSGSPFTAFSGGGNFMSM